MNINFNKDKLLTICILPIMWLVYFAFEIITGRVNDFYTLILNLSLTIIFALVGFIIYIVSQKYANGFSTKSLFIIFAILMLIDQGLKLIIKLNYFDIYFEIIPKFLSFDPIINTQGSWLNARFNFNLGFPFLIFINTIALALFYELYRYVKHNKNGSDFWIDMCFLFIVAGALCSLIDKVFYGGSLDFIGISDLFIADIKDIYINLGLLFFIMSAYKSEYLKDDENSSLKDDWEGIKKFLKFVKSDIKLLNKKEKA